jgi:hypothetical protein
MFELVVTARGVALRGFIAPVSTRELEHSFLGQSVTTFLYSELGPIPDHRIYIWKMNMTLVLSR